MSTYLRTNRTRLNPYDDNVPLVWDYLKFAVEESRTLSLRSSNIYYVNIRLFLRYLKALRRDLDLALYDSLTIGDLSDSEIIGAQEEDIRSFINFRRTLGDSELSIRQKLTCLSGFYAYLVNRKLVKVSPLSEIQRPTPKRQAASTLSHDEIRLLLGTALEREFATRDHCIASLLAYSGLNLAELCRLNVDDVADADKTGKICVLRHGKQMEIFVDKHCRGTICDWLDERNKIKLDESEKALFVSPHTRHRITGRQVEKIISACFSISGLSQKGYNIVSLRNTAAALQQKKGISDKEISHRLGNDNVISTRHLLRSLANEESEDDE